MFKKEDVPMDEMRRIQDKLIKRNGKQVFSKHKSDLDKYLIFCFTVIILYTITGIIFQWITGIELSTALTVGVYGFFGGEITLLAMIKKHKLKEGDTNDERFNI